MSATCWVSWFNDAWMGDGERTELVFLASARVISPVRPLLLATIVAFHMMMMFTAVACEPFGASTLKARVPARIF